MLKIFRITFFSLFIIIGSILFQIIFLFRPGNPKNTALYMSFVRKFISPIMGMHFKVENSALVADDLPGVIVSNHQHNWDYFTVCYMCPINSVAFGKKILGRIPIFGTGYLLGGNITVDRKNKEKAKVDIAKAVKKIKKYKAGIIIFPEGTRNPTKKLIPFKYGAFKLAIENNLPLIPFSVSSYAESSNLNNRVAVNATIKKHPIIETKDLTIDDIESVREKVRHIIQEGIDELNRKNQS